MALKMVKYGTCTVWRTRTIIKDKNGIPDFMTLFFMDPRDGKPDEKDVPDMFKVNGKIVQGVAISQFHNTEIKGVPHSLPYNMPIESKTFTQAEEMCKKKGPGWHLLTNTEFVYLLNEAEKMGKTIHGNTNYGKCADAPEERGALYDGYCTLTGCDPLTWSHDGTEEGVFGLCGNYWEPVTGLRLRKGRIEYIKDNDAAAVDTSEESKNWLAICTKNSNAEHADMYCLDTLYLDVQMGSVTLTDKQIAGNWGGDHYRDLKLAGTLEEVPEIIHKLGIVPKNYKEEKAGIWVDSTLEEAVPLRGSSFSGTSFGGAAALDLSGPRTGSDFSVSLRSALILEDWELVTETLKGAW